MGILLYVLMDLYRRTNLAKSSTAAVSRRGNDVITTGAGALLCGAEWGPGVAGRVELQSTGARGAATEQELGELSALGRRTAASVSGVGCCC